jgi:replication-associated recombination protein RarA
MLQSGENPLFIVRRLIVAASEDIGLANNALQTYATLVYLMIEKLGIKDTVCSGSTCCDNVFVEEEHSILSWSKQCSCCIK